MTDSKPIILFVDDAMALLEQFTTILEWDGYHVLSAGRADDVLDHIDQAERIDLAILDLELPIEGSDRIPAMLKGDGREMGLLLGEQFRRKFPDSPILFWSGSANESLRARTLELPKSYIFPKNVGPRFIQQIVHEILSTPDRTPSRKAFIVHGHADDILEELRDWLNKEFKTVEPIVLRDMRSGGETLIDKLETYALGTDLVFVLLTPDDTVLASRQDKQSRRARQNVVFEMGYFFGRLGRRTGRIVLLSQGEVELPSDIHGMVTIDVTEGVTAASESIRREIGGH